MKHLIICLFFLVGCGHEQNSTPVQSASEGNKTEKNTGKAKQINMTILLDLSDRIDPVKNPEKPDHASRDSILINYLTHYFIGQMRSNGTFLAKGKLRVVFHPNPPDPEINQAAKKLNIDLSQMDTKGKKDIYENLETTIDTHISTIYRKTISGGQWPGSDIWRFFKNDVHEITIDRDSSYRNILVIFTDGYIYHHDSKDQQHNRFAYILPELLDQYRLRNNPEWEEKIEEQDIGLISKRNDLNNLEVLVLEVTPSQKHKNDEDILRKIIEKWFAEMKVRRWKILNSDLPEYTKQKIENFLSNK